MGEKMEFQKLDADKQSDTEYFLLMDKVYQITGYDFHGYKDTTIKRRLAQRLEATNCKTYEEYINYLDDNQDEYNNLVSTLVVNVTQFFRDKEDWQVIKDKVLPEIIVRRLMKTLTIWSIACASGEEPYSLAIIFHEILGDESEKIDIRIYGTDINEDCLNKAREGIYDERGLKDVDTELIKKYFHQRSSESYQINNEIKSTVRFLKHSIINGENFSGFDFIICRNLLIYFTRELQEKVYWKLYNALKPGGLLWLGKAENPVGKASKAFKSLYYKERIYQK